ncbi:MAG: phosphate ABC transporter substrate-binding protein PstS family protein [Spirochaetaceae bacterium]|nr:phosphate ABC transporter substrate-binding protein PstS family protein [Spirochaetaceae bacterium]
MKKAIIVLAIALAAAASFAQGKFPWVDSVSDDKDKILPGVDPALVVGTIVTAGSSTVFPLSEAVAERFAKEGYAGQVSIDSIGTGAGFERFAKTGETDIANASRAIKSSEVDWAKALTPPRNPIGFQVGTDALAVCVSAKNKFIQDATTKELALIFSTAALWSDVRPTWPKKEIKRFSPGTDSGTFDYFVEHVFAKKREPILGAKNLQLSEDDNVLVQGIAGDEFTIGYFGYAYAVENKGKLRPISVDGVEPNQANVDANKYPLSRPLFLYSDTRIINEKPQVAAFLTYYLTYVNDMIKKVGYFPATADALKKSKTALAEAMKGKF